MGRMIIFPAVIALSIALAAVGCGKGEDNPVAPVTPQAPPPPWNPIDTLLVLLYDEGGTEWAIATQNDAFSLGPGDDQNKEFIGGFIYDKRDTLKIAVIGVGLTSDKFRENTYYREYAPVDSISDPPAVPFDQAIHVPEVLFFATYEWREEICNPIGQCIWITKRDVKLQGVYGSTVFSWASPYGPPAFAPSDRMPNLRE